MLKRSTDDSMPDRTTTPSPSDEESQGDELANLFGGSGSGEVSSEVDDGSDGKRGQGRPRKSKGERKSERVAIYFTPAQLAEVEAKAEAAGRSRSSFIRRAALGQDITPKADAETRHRLQRAGANLNQLAKVASATDEIDAKERLEAALDTLKEAARKIG